MVARPLLCLSILLSTAVSTARAQDRLPTLKDTYLEQLGIEYPTVRKK